MRKRWIIFLVQIKSSVAGAKSTPPVRMRCNWYWYNGSFYDWVDGVNFRITPTHWLLLENIKI